MKITKCIICSTGRTHFNFTKKSLFDDKYYDIFKCINCQSGFVYPVIKQEYLNDFYNSLANPIGGNIASLSIPDYLEKIIESEHEYPNTIIDAVRLIGLTRKFASGNYLLDVGAGFGFFTKEAIKHGFKCEAIEISKTNCEIFSSLNGFYPNQSYFDEQFATKHSGKYDVILLSQIIEHIPYPDNFVKNIQIALKKGGICVVAVPHFGSVISKIQASKDMFVTPPEHINYFSIKGLELLFSSHQMSSLHTQTISRYDNRKIVKKFGKLISLPLNIMLTKFLSMSDRLLMGMYINSIFIKN